MRYSIEDVERILDHECSGRALDDPYDLEEVSKVVFRMIRETNREAFYRGKGQAVAAIRGGIDAALREVKTIPPAGRREDEG